MQFIAIYSIISVQKHVIHHKQTNPHKCNIDQEHPCGYVTQVNRTYESTGHAYAKP